MNKISKSILIIMLLQNLTAKASIFFEAGRYKSDNFTVDITTSNNKMFQSLEILENGAYLATLEMNSSTLSVGGFCNEDSGITSEVNYVDGVIDAKCENAEGAKVAMQLVEKNGGISSIDFEVKVRRFGLWTTRRKFNIENLKYVGPVPL